MAVSWSGAATARGYESHVQFNGSRRSRTRGNTWLSGTRPISTSHSCDLRIGVDSGLFASEIRLCQAPHRVLLNDVRERWLLSFDVRANAQTLFGCSTIHDLPAESCAPASLASASTSATRCRQYRCASASRASVSRNSRTPSAYHGAGSSAWISGVCPQRTRMP
jgi:hypothetical protein